MPYTVRTIQQLIGGQFTGDMEQPISGIATLEQAQPGELAFAEHNRYVPKVRESRASVIIVTETFPVIEGKSLLRVKQPRAAFVKVMMMFQPVSSTPTGLHPSAQISPEAVLAEGVTVGECAVIRAKARLGRGTVIDSGAHVGAGVEIGEGCRIGANVVLCEGTRLGHRVRIHGGAVIGEDGFGYVWTDGRHLKIPQLGNVVIEDDVEIGSNVCVDRGMIGSTIIRQGTKIDNLVQIAHNDVIGQHVIMAGQVGLAGSVTVGDRTMLGGQSGAVDHVTIGADARIGAATPVTKDVKAGEMVWGFPARPIARVKHELASVALLPQLFKRFREALGRISRTESRLDRLERQRPTP